VGPNQTATVGPSQVAKSIVAGIRAAHVLLHVNLQGNARILWRSPGASGETLAYPPPDGRHLAIQNWVANGNMWMMENF